MRQGLAQALTDGVFTGFDPVTLARRGQQICGGRGHLNAITHSSTLHALWRGREFKVERPMPCGAESGTLIIDDESTYSRSIHCIPEQLETSIVST